MRRIKGLLGVPTLPYITTNEANPMDVILEEDYLTEEKHLLRPKGGSPTQS